MPPIINLEEKPGKVVGRHASRVFFSGRRRHTSSKRDWSSDVCSSDLVERIRGVLADVGGQVTALRAQPADDPDADRLVEAWNDARDAEYRELAGECAKFLAEIEHEFRSEERRVGEGCGALWVAASVSG